MTDQTPQPARKRGNAATSVSGEHFVAAELSKRGWTATLTSKNTPEFDALAVLPGTDLRITVQVKTRGAYKYAWRVSSAGPTGAHDFFVFVDLGADDEAPKYWVVPSATVAELITEHNQIRTKDISQYAERWDLLTQPAV